MRIVLGGESKLIDMDSVSAQLEGRWVMNKLIVVCYQYVENKEIVSS